MKSILPILTCALLAGCLERDEEITVRADGSVDVRLRYRGDRGDFDDTLDFPSGSRWRIDRTTETEQTDDGPREKWIWTASATLDDLNDLPDCFAAADVAHRDRHFRSGTRLNVTRRGDLRIYEFERAIPAYDLRAFSRIDEAFLHDPDMAPLLDRVGEGGIDTLTAAERAEFFGQVAAAEHEKQVTLASLAADAAGLRWGDRIEALDRVGDVLHDRLTGDAVESAVRDLLDAAEGERGEQLARFMEDLRTSVRDALGTGLADDFDSEHAAWRSGQAVQDDHFRLRVRFPGEVVAGNARSIENDGRTAVWEFNGPDLAEGLTLRAVAVETVR